MALAYEGKDGVNSSDWLFGCMSIHLHQEAALTASVGSTPWKRAENQEVPDEFNLENQFGCARLRQRHSVIEITLWSKVGLHPYCSLLMTLKCLLINIKPSGSCSAP